MRRTLQAKDRRTECRRKRKKNSSCCVSNWTSSSCATHSHIWHENWIHKTMWFDWAWDASHRKPFIWRNETHHSQMIHTPSMSYNVKNQHKVAALHLQSQLHLRLCHFIGEDVRVRSHFTFPFKMCSHFIDTMAYCSVRSCTRPQPYNAQIRSSWRMREYFADNFWGIAKGNQLWNE